MAETPSTMLPLGTIAADFFLPDVEGKRHTLADVIGTRGLLVAFICNHCPFVKHLQVEFARLAKHYQPLGLATVAIASNDLDSYPQDGLDGMRQQAQRAGFSFPYLLDDTQTVAKLYRAACTPDFYLFDAARQLTYRGQFDSSRPGNGQEVTGNDLRAACEALLAGQPPLDEQRPSIGCNIKWKRGQAPAYARS